MNQENYSEEVKKMAFEKVASIKIYQLHLLTEIINLASSRGSFRGAELSHVGTLFDTLTTGIDKAMQMSKEDLAKVAEKLPTVVEEEESTPLIGKK
jgi:hypothetical protein